MSIGTRLRQLRTSHSLSQDSLGEICGVTKGMVSQWELDIVTPPTDRLLALKTKIDFSFDWLLDGEEAAPVYATSDPTMVEILKVLQPRGEYEKIAAHKAVVTTIELLDHAAQASNPIAPTKTHRPPDRRLGLQLHYGGPDRRGAENKNAGKK